MGLIIIFLLITLGITLLSYVGTASERKEVKRSNAIFGFVMVSLIFIAIAVVMAGASYESYVEMREDKATVEQYANTMKNYEKHGVKEFRSLKNGSLTDLKYNKYQEQLAKMTIDLRDRIVHYNEIYAGKKAMKDNFFFGLFVIFPEDMKPIKLSDYL